MVIEHKMVDDLRAVVNIKVQPDDYKDRVEEILNSYRKSANIPGFRKGKVPVGMIRQMMGKNVLVDELNKIISEKLNGYIQEKDLKILGNPLPKEDEMKPLDLDAQEEFDFAYEVGMAPDVKVEVSSKYKFDYYKITVNDETIDKYVTDASRRYGQVAEADSVEETDLVFGQFVELVDDGQPLEGGIMHDGSVVLDNIKDDKVKGKFIGAKVDDVIEVDPATLTENPTDRAAMLGVSADQIESVSNKFKFTVRRISRLTPAEVNQELFDKVYGPEAVSSEEEFRGRIKEDLERSLVMDADRKLMSDIEETLLGKLKITLPDDFLKRWLVSTNEELTPERVDEDYENYAKGLKWQLIENTVIREHNVEVSQDEAVNYTKALVVNQMQQYGAPIPEDEELTQTAMRVLGNEDEARNIYQGLYDQKLLALYKENFKLKEKEIDYDKFVEIAKK